MDDKIRVLIVDDILETRESVRKLLQFEADLSVVGHAGSGMEALAMAKKDRAYYQRQIAKFEKALEPR